MKQTTQLVIVVALLMVSTVALAASYDVKVEPINDVISLGQKAKYKLIITNFGGTINSFRIKTLDYPLWEVSVQPASNPITFKVMPQSNRTVEFYVSPLQIDSLGVYDVNLQVKRENTEESSSTPVRINIVSPDAGVYVETVLASIIMDSQINPAKPIPIKIRINNQNAVDYPDLRITLESDLFSDSFKANLGKKEKKTIELVKNIDADTPPGTDTIVVTVTANNKTLDTEVKRVEIIKFRKLDTRTDTTNKFLKQVNEITYMNSGNIAYEATVRVKTSILESLFTSSFPKGFTQKEGNERFLALKVNIPAGEQLKWRVTKNYFTLLVITVLVAILVILYFGYRTPLVIRKTATNIVFKEGGVSELKIVLHVKNRGKERLNEIHIIDRVPNIADLEGGISIGTLHPMKVLKHEKKGTIIKWLIDRLEPEDERVITYKMKSHLPILGAFTLQQAVGSYNFKNKKQIAHSNSLDISPASE
jgi:hypothetical protein